MQLSSSTPPRVKLRNYTFDHKIQGRRNVSSPRKDNKHPSNNVIASVVPEARIAELI
jgi:hypothetical protein